MKMFVLRGEDVKAINEMNHRVEALEVKVEQLECEHPQEDANYKSLRDRPRSGWLLGWRKKICGLCGKDLGLVELTEKPKSK